jgi:predicted amidohydrolase YtcJ
MYDKNIEAPDLILYGGCIVSCDDNNRVYEAIAVKGEKILNLGSNDEILSMKSDYTKCIDLCGKMVIPGLIDSHTHFFDSALTELKGEIFIPSSVNEALNFIKEKVKHIEAGEWIHFRNTYPTRLAEYRFPSIEELDLVAPDNPVILNGFYAAQVNSCALKIMGLDENTIIPTGILCKNDLSGKLNGLLFNCPYLVSPYISEHSFEPTETDIIDAIEILQNNYNRLGITSVIDGGITSATDPTTPLKHVNACNHLYSNGELNIRIAYTCVVDSIQSAEYNTSLFLNAISTPKEWGHARFFKVFLDGGILTGTAYMRKPYGSKWSSFGIADNGYRGTISYEKDQLVEFIKKADELGLQMTAHCTGNASTDRLLSAYEEVDKATPISDKRYAIIHADFTDSDTLKKSKELGIVLHSQPAWHYKDGSVLDKILDESTMNSFLPYREMEELSVRVCAGSDHMVKYDPDRSENPYNPFIGMYNIITRKTRLKDEVRPSQKVSRERALKMYTIEGAYATFDENIKGSLEIGKLADMAVLSKDLFACTEDDILNIESELTIVGGRTIYKK